MVEDPLCALHLTSFGVPLITAHSAYKTLKIVCTRPSNSFVSFLLYQLCPGPL